MVIIHALHLYILGKTDDSLIDQELTHKAGTVHGLLPNLLYMCGEDQIVK